MNWYLIKIGQSFLEWQQKRDSYRRSEHLFNSQPRPDGVKDKLWSPVLVPGSLRTTHAQFCGVCWRLKHAVYPQYVAIVKRKK